MVYKLVSESITYKPTLFPGLIVLFFKTTYNNYMDEYAEEKFVYIFFIIENVMHFNSLNLNTITFFLLSFARTCFTGM